MYRGFETAQAYVFSIICKVHLKIWANLKSVGKKGLTELIAHFDHDLKFIIGQSRDVGAGGEPMIFCGSANSNK